MRLLFPQGLPHTLRHSLRLGQGDGAVIVPLVLPALRHRQHQPFVIQKDMPVVQVEIIVPVRTPLEGIVKGCVHVVPLFVYCQYIPCVAVFHTPLRVRLAESHDALHPHGVAQGLHRFGNALAHAHPLGQGADDLM